MYLMSSLSGLDRSNKVDIGGLDHYSAGSMTPSYYILTCRQLIAY